MTFEDNGSPLQGNSTVTLVNGAATFQTSALAVGDHSITAVYSGDINFEVNTSTVDLHPVTAAASTTTITSAAGADGFGQPAAFIASVAASTTDAVAPTGSVTFENDGQPLPGNSTVPVIGGAATYVANGLAIGDYAVTAVYAGDGNYAARALPPPLPWQSTRRAPRQRFRTQTRQPCSARQTLLRFWSLPA